MPPASWIAPLRRLTGLLESQATLSGSAAPKVFRGGVDSWAIQLLGRWGSSAVLGYIQQVPLELSAQWAMRAAKSWSIEQATAAYQAAQPLGIPSLVDDLPLAAGSRDVLLDDLRHEAGVASALPSSADQFILASGYRGKWHRVPPAGAVAPLASWATVCG